MSDIKNIMASKYPSKKKEGLQQPFIVSSTISQPSYSWNNNKVLACSFILGILFLIVSLPKTYQTTGDIFGIINKDDFTNCFSFKLSFIHSIIFIIMTYIFISVLNSM